MKPTVAVIAPGNMGAAVGARLVERGAKVLTSLAGRSAESAQRARTAGMVSASDAELAAADFVLSIVPPKEALPLAERLASCLSATNRKPIYVDCNAVSPQTIARIAGVIEETGCAFVDGGIIGGPPRAGYQGPSFFVSGTEAKRTEALGEYGLLIRVMEGPIGAASALKMCFGGVTKGLTAVGAAMALAAHRAGVAEALKDELLASHPQVFARLEQAVPDMFPKAYRWVAEMEEIASFVGDRAERDLYRGIAGFYERLAGDFQHSRKEIEALAEFFARPPKKN